MIGFVFQWNLYYSYDEMMSLLVSFAKLICCWGAVSNSLGIYVGNISFFLLLFVFAVFVFMFFVAGDR
jgi:hypothetical protein